MILAAGAGLFFLKYSVQQQEADLAAMRAQYLEDQKALRVLKAEWTYLNSPQYLQVLARRYLTLQPMTSAQVVAWSGEGPGDLRPVALLRDTPPYLAKDAVQASLPLPPGREEEP